MDPNLLINMSNSPRKPSTLPRVYIRGNFSNTLSFGLACKLVAAAVAPSSTQLSPF